MKFKCFIIDDEQHCINTLSRIIERIPELHLEGTTTCALDAIKILKELPSIDLLFLDINMPNLTGLELLKVLPYKMNIIFTSGYPEFALNGFEVNATDFLVKPITISRLLQSVEKIKIIGENNKRSLSEKNPFIFFNTGGKGNGIQLKINDIIYIEGLKNFVVIYTEQNGKHISYLTLSEVHGYLQNENFIRIHKSYIINTSKIFLLEGNIITLVNKQKIPIGSTHKMELQNFLFRYTIKTKRT